jgi:hypothetical protein
MNEKIIPIPTKFHTSSNLEGPLADVHIFPYGEKVVPNDVSPSVVDAIVRKNKGMQGVHMQIPTQEQEPVLSQLEALQVVHDLLGITEQLGDFDEGKRLQIARDVASALGNLTDQQKGIYRAALGHIGMISTLIQSELK